MLDMSAILTYYHKIFVNSPSWGVLGLVPILRFIYYNLLHTLHELSSYYL